MEIEVKIISEQILADNNLMSLLYSQNTTVKVALKIKELYGCKLSMAYKVMKIIVSEFYNLSGKE